MGARLARLEASAPALTLVKFANIALSMLWGFAVTYVFVRVLGVPDFRSFLVLVAFNNFTISAEFGLTNIIYARLRRFWLGQRHEGSDFRFEEIGALFLLLLGLIMLACLLVFAALAGGLIVTSVPVLFVLFFLASALNVQLLLAKRALAAIDRNLLWEAVDLARRLLALAALVAVLTGFDLFASVVVQLVTSLAAIIVAMVLLHRRLGMHAGQWLALRRGGGHMRRTYARDIGASMALTLSEIIAYNVPYFTIAALTRETRLLLLFDFLFKLSRAVSTAIRAAIEAQLPRITAARFAGDRAGFDRLLGRACVVAGLIALVACGLLAAVGQRLFAHLFDGRAMLSLSELWLVCVVLLALALICVSVYVQGALGRFTELLGRSLPFLAGSLFLMPLAVALARVEPAIGLDMGFMALNAALFVAVAGLHIRSLARLRRSP